MADPITEEDSILTLAIKDMSFDPWQARPDRPKGETPAQAYNAQRNHWMALLDEKEPWSLGIFVENYPPRTDLVGGRAEGVKLNATVVEAGRPYGITPAGLPEDISAYVREHRASDTVVHEVQEQTKRESILRTANDIIHGDREKDYGRPVDSFTRLAEALNLVLRPKLREGVELDAVDAAVLMIAMKLSRLAGGDRKDDTWVDLAGYSALGAEVRDQQ